MYRPCGDVRILALPEGGGALLFRGGEKIAVLNRTAHYLWRILKRGDSACLAPVLVSRFGLSPEDARRDVDATLGDWRVKGLIGDALEGFSGADPGVTPRAGAAERGGATLFLSVGGQNIHLHAPEFLARRISALCGRFVERRADAEAIDCSVDLYESDRGSLTVDGRMVVASAPPEILIGAFYETLIRRLHPGTGWRAMIHAGAVGWNGRAAILAAPSGSGKSTLTAYLVAQGFDYLADDLAPLRESDHAVAPFPMPISIKPGAVTALAKYYALDLNRPGEEQLLIQNASFDAPFIPATALVFPQYVADARTRFDVVSVQDALVRLLSDRIYFGFPIEARQLAEFIRWLREIRIRALIYSDLAEAKECMTQILTA